MYTPIHICIYVYIYIRMFKVYAYVYINMARFTYYRIMYPPSFFRLETKSLERCAQRVRSYRFASRLLNAGSNVTSPRPLYTSYHVFYFYFSLSLFRSCVFFLSFLFSPLSFALKASSLVSPMSSPDRDRSDAPSQKRRCYLFHFPSFPKPFCLNEARVI